MPKALVLEAPGEEPSLAVREVGTPTLGPHDVLVEVAACGMCRHDVAVMQGVLRRGVKPEIVLGHEISGRVVGIGPSTESVKVRDRVTTTLTTFCGRCQPCLDGREYRCVDGRGIGHAIDGGFAQLVRVPESCLVAVPDGVELEEASIFGCPMGVALRALRDVAELQSGETVLVTGAGGGLGVHAVQIASAMGATVIAVTTSSDKVERLERLGVAEVILADELDFSEFAMALTEDRGVDVVVNTVGSAVFGSSVRSLTQFGRMVVLGEVAGEKALISLAELLFRDAKIVTSTGAGARHIAGIGGLVASGRISPVVSEKFALEDAAKAYHLMRANQTFGRVVLVP
jgi:D-arabinose 1-dehydrogenase-like Zn-dependent alcohol dehydrogenase